MSPRRYEELLKAITREDVVELTRRLIRFKSINTLAAAVYLDLGGK